VSRYRRGPVLSLKDFLRRSLKLSPSESHIFKTVSQETSRSVTARLESDKEEEEEEFLRVRRHAGETADRSNVKNWSKVKTLVTLVKIQKESGRASSWCEHTLPCPLPDHLDPKRLSLFIISLPP